MNTIWSKIQESWGILAQGPVRIARMKAQIDQRGQKLELGGIDREG